MSKQLRKNITDGRVKSLLKSYLEKKLRLISSGKWLALKEVDSLNLWLDGELVEEKNFN